MWVSTHTLKAHTHLLLANYPQIPLDKVVVEYAFVKLMKDVGRDAGKDIGEGKIFPKEFIDCAQTFHFKLF